MDFPGDGMPDRAGGGSAGKAPTALSPLFVCRRAVSLPAGSFGDGMDFPARQVGRGGLGHPPGGIYRRKLGAHLAIPDLGPGPLPRGDRVYRSFHAWTCREAGQRFTDAHHDDSRLLRSPYADNYKADRICAGRFCRGPGLVLVYPAGRQSAGFATGSAARERDVRA